jgi:hypothetical protein
VTLDDLREMGILDDQQQQEREYQQQQAMQQQQQMQMYNPFAQRQPSSWDAIMADRLLTVKRPKDVKSGEMWITESGLAEIFSLMPIGKADQDEIMDDFYRIQMLASGELNRKIVDSRQERLLTRLLIQKSRLDAVEGGNINERGAWITSRQLFEQTLRQPQPQRPKGFIEGIVDGFSGRR